MAVVRRTACPRCRAAGGDNSGDNLVHYSDGGSRCFTCHYTILSCAERVKRGLPVTPEQEAIAEITPEDIEETKSEGVSAAFVRKLKASTTQRGRLYRGISDVSYKRYWVLHEYNGRGEVFRQFYPIFKEIDGVTLLSRFKTRLHPKEFGSIGKSSKQEMFFGELSFKNITSKFCVIAAGEIDTMSAHTMLYKEFGDVPCVCAVNGESATLASMKRRLDFLNRFEHVLLILDEDKAGREQVGLILQNEELKQGLTGRLHDVRLSACEELNVGDDKVDLNVVLTKGYGSHFVNYIKGILC